ncbi:hypothetical protein [Zongyangia hominis]|uniref:DUF3021 domain-containing protein n=1 Tax=Zongyangia hominis TaxID=2763677 RepID=A0A926EBC8_9FIRM|nr:hypothetical protein [Zongyangia hominis]MBC8570673.1 hypothetical protein [Zongyangia hominis]
MKKFIEIVLGIKSYMALVFGGILIVYGVVSFLFCGVTAISYLRLLEILVVAATAAVLHFIAFSDVVIKRMAYGCRILLSSLTMLAVLCLYAVLFHWFPLEKLGDWMIFLLIAAALIAIITAAFQISFQLAGKKYTQMLDAYKKSQPRA